MEKTMEEAFSCSFLSLVALLLLLIILNWLIMPHFHSNLRYALMYLFLQINGWSGGKTIQKRCCIDKKVGDGDDKPSKEVETNSRSPQVPIHENIVDREEQLCVGELGPIMEKLGTLCDADGELDGRLDLFEEEPSLEEVKEAFLVFDENKDGFIDAGEINKVFCALGFAEASEVECRRMIKAFDDNGDGRIDFNEFVQLMESSFC